MKKFLLLIIFLGVLLFGRTEAYGLDIIKIPREILIQPTSTPTPTPTPTIFIRFIPPVFRTLSTPTPLPPTPTNTPTSTPTPEIKKDLSPTKEPEISGPIQTPSASPTPVSYGKIFGQNVSLKEVVLLGLVVLLLLIIILQNRWPKIKKWLHQKTE